MDPGYTQWGDPSLETDMAKRGPKNIPNMILRGNLWAARLQVPLDAREALKRSVFVRSTETADLLRAATIAKPWLADWKDQIAATRQGRVVSVQARIDLARAAWAAAVKADRDTWEAVEDDLRELGIVSEQEELSAARYPRWRATPRWKRLTDQGHPTPFAAHIDAWVRGGLQLRRP